MLYKSPHIELGQATEALWRAGKEGPVCIVGFARIKIVGQEAGDPEWKTTPTATYTMTRNRYDGQAAGLQATWPEGVEQWASEGAANRVLFPPPTSERLSGGRF